MSSDDLRKIDELDARLRAGDWSALPEWNAIRANLGLPPRSRSDYDESWRYGEGRSAFENGAIAGKMALKWLFGG